MIKYDFVVVGAGNAGLTAALELVSSGKKTLLIEQHNLPGGCASSFRRGRFEFDPSLHELCGVSTEDKPGEVRRIMDEYGAKINWCCVDDCFRVVSKFSDGSPMDVTMPTGSQAFIDKMDYYVPGSKQKMTDFFDLLHEVSAGLRFASSGGADDVKALIKQYPNLLRTGIYSTSKVFEAVDLPQKCRDILAVYWSYLGVDLENLSFVHYCAMVENYVDNGAYIPAHTSHEISVALSERFRELGGDIWFNCRANKFLFDGDRCCGVETTMGTVECDCVIANINPDIIYGNMMPKNLIPEREKKLSAARNKDFGARMFTAYFGLNKTAEEIGIKDYSIFMPGTADSVKEYESMKRVDTNEYSIFLCYNVANPGFSPKGTSVCSFTTFYSSPIDWNDLSFEEYFKLKNKIAKSFIDTLKAKTGIDIAPYIEEMSVSSPWTFARYLNAPEGSVYGYNASGWDGIVARFMMVDMDYPIKGLVPVGTSGPRGDGYSSTYVCGKMMAQFALKKLAQGGNN